MWWFLIFSFLAWSLFLISCVWSIGGSPTWFLSVPPWRRQQHWAISGLARQGLLPSGRCSAPFSSHIHFDFRFSIRPKSLSNFFVYYKLSLASDFLSGRNSPTNIRCLKAEIFIILSKTRKQLQRIISETFFFNFVYHFQPTLPCSYIRFCPPNVAVLTPSLSKVESHFLFIHFRNAKSGKFPC